MISAIIVLPAPTYRNEKETLVVARSEVNMTLSSAAAELFRKSWNTYQKIVQSNKMSHVEAYRSLQVTLNKRMNHRRSFHFLDLACGDATHSCLALKGNTNCTRYTGIDLSETALEYARQSIQQHLPTTVTSKELLLGDFCDYESIIKKRNGTKNTTNYKEDERLDVVWVGLSLHHLETEEKGTFMKTVTKNLAPDDGLFMIYEPTIFQKDSQNRDEYNDHITTVVNTMWCDVLDKEELELVLEHAYAQDLPETTEHWIQLGKDAGFQDVEIMYEDPNQMYAAFCFHM